MDGATVISDGEESVVFFQLAGVEDVDQGVRRARQDYVPIERVERELLMEGQQAV